MKIIIQNLKYAYESHVNHFYRILMSKTLNSLSHALQHGDQPRWLIQQKTAPGPTTDNQNFLLDKKVPHLIFILFFDTQRKWNNNYEKIKHSKKLFSYIIFGKISYIFLSIVLNIL